MAKDQTAPVPVIAAPLLFPEAEEVRVAQTAEVVVLLLVMAVSMAPEVAVPVMPRAA
jgi:hypothetical protein